MPTYTLCREYVVSQSVLGQFFEWVTTLGIEGHVRLDLDFRPGSSLDWIQLDRCERDDYHCSRTLKYYLE